MVKKKGAYFKNQIFSGRAATHNTRVL